LGREHRGEEETMGTRHLARLHDRYTEWVGLYGTGSTVVIQLIEESDGRERVRRKWTAQGEVENPDGGRTQCGSTSPMPNTVWILLVAAVTAVVTALAVGLFVTPRMEARKKRLGEVHTARDTFGANTLRVISACSLLQRFELPAADDPDWTPVMRERLIG
jgi:hypothetical protein